MKKFPAGITAVLCLTVRLLLPAAPSALAALAATGVTLTAAPVHAENEAEGRKRFMRGQELYKEGRYLEAAREFEAGYLAAPRSAFVLNIAHSYRRAGELEKARASYLKFLEEEPNTPQRSEVEAHLRAIDDALTARDMNVSPNAPAAQKKPPPPPVPEAPLVSADSAFRRTIDPAALEDDAQPEDTEPEDEGGSVFGKAWFWVIVGTLAVGAGIAAATLSRSDEGCDATACFVEPPGM